MASREQILVEEFQNARERSNTNPDIMESFNREWNEVAQSGSLGFNSLSLPKLTEHFVGESRFNRWRRGSFGDVFEDIQQAMVSSQFDQFLSQTVEKGVIENMAMADTSLFNLVDTSIDLDCENRTTHGWFEIGDVARPAVELEGTKFFGLDGRTRTFPEPEKVKFALALTREALCTDKDGGLRAAMRDGAKWIRVHQNKLIADMVFETNKNFQFTENGVTQNLYQPSGGSWHNELVAELDGSYATFQAIQTLLENTVDPYTLEPVINVLQDLIFTSDEAIHWANMALGVQQLRTNVVLPTATPADSGQAFGPQTGGNNPVAGANALLDLTKPSISGFGGVQIVDHYARKRVEAYYGTADGEFPGDVARTLPLIDAKKTFVAADADEAFGYASEWPLEVLERSSPNTSEYFQREVVLAVKYLHKGTPVVKDPRKAIRVTPFLIE